MESLAKLAARHGFFCMGGSRGQFEQWWATRQVGPGGPLIINRYEYESAKYWLEKLGEWDDPAWIVAG